MGGFREGLHIGRDRDFHCVAPRIIIGKCAVHVNDGRGGRMTGSGGCGVDVGVGVNPRSGAKASANSGGSIALAKSITAIVMTRASKAISFCILPPTPRERVYQARSLGRYLKKEKRMIAARGTRGE